MIAPRLYLGTRKHATSAAILDALNIQHVLSVTSQRAPQTAVARHMWINVFDSALENLLQHFPAACEFIDNAVSEGEASELVWNDDDGGWQEWPIKPPAVLVHCETGKSRGPTVVMAYLMRKHDADWISLLAFIQWKRENVDINMEFLCQLAVWGECRYKLWDELEIDDSADDKAVQKRTTPTYGEFLFDRLISQTVMDRLRMWLVTVHVDGRAGCIDPERDVDDSELGSQDLQRKRKWSD